MVNPQRTYDDWDWWTGAGAQSAALKEFESLQVEGQAALAEVMKRWLKGEHNRKEYELLEPDLHELKTRVKNNQYRVLFSIRGGVCWVLTALYKNQQQTPEKDKRRARGRRSSLPAE